MSQVQTVSDFTVTSIYFVLWVWIGAFVFKNVFIGVMGTCPSRINFGHPLVTSHWSDFLFFFLNLAQNCFPLSMHVQRHCSQQLQQHQRGFKSTKNRLLEAEAV
jgi:hypothetical protein